MRMWHSYTMRRHENGRSSSAVSYVILRMGSGQPQKSALSPSTLAGHGGRDVAAMSFALEQYSWETK